MLKKARIKLDTQHVVLRESSHVFMTFGERQRHFPSAVSTQRGQFSKSSALFRFMGPAVHSQVSDLSIPALWFFFLLYSSNKATSPRGSQGKIYHLTSTWGPEMRTYLALFSHTYLHRWCGCHKKRSVFAFHILQNTLHQLYLPAVHGADKMFSSIKLTLSVRRNTQNLLLQLEGKHSSSAV